MVINSTNQYQQNEQLSPILTELTEHKNYRKSQSDLKVFSNRRPFQILRSILCLIFDICAAYKYLL